MSVLTSAPYGYRYIPKQDGSDAHYEVIFEEAQVVRKIYQWYVCERLSIHHIVMRLQREGIASKTGKAYWQRSTVFNVLRNPAYRGDAAFGKTRIGERKATLRPQRGHSEQPRRAYSVHNVPSEQWIHIPVPALVSTDIFEAAHERLSDNRLHWRAPRSGPRDLLTGLVVCRQCGYTYYGRTASRAASKGHYYRYFRCGGTDAYRYGGQKACHNRPVRAEWLHQVVWDDVSALLADPQRLQQEYRRRLRGAGCSFQAQRHPIRHPHRPALVDNRIQTEHG